MLTVCQIIIYFRTSGLAVGVHLLSRILSSQLMDFSWAVACACSTGKDVTLAYRHYVSFFVLMWQRCEYAAYGYFRAISL